MAAVNEGAVMHEYVKKSEPPRKHGRHTESGRTMRSQVIVRQLPASAPLGWLKQGVRDVVGSGFLSLLYGAAFVLMGLGIDRAHADHPVVALGLAAGFLFVGPFLALGLYELSRQMQMGERVDLILSLFSWCRNPAAVGRFALFLSVVMLVWLWLSATLLNALDQRYGVLFAGALLAWATLALIVFMASAVAIPMLLHRPVNALQAMHASIRCCQANPLALAVWAVTIGLLVGISLSLGYWLLLVTGPVLGHATWHAYKACLTDEPND
jgi:uncharacterized membrane protein